MTPQQPASNWTVVHVNLPERVLPSNCIIFALGYANGTGTPVLTITDDKGNSWGAPTVSDTDSIANYTLAVWVRPGATVDTRQVIVTVTGGTISYIQAFAAEEYNIATSSPLDGTQHTHGTSATWGPGSLTTTVDGDVIYTLSVDDGGAGPYGQFSPGSGAEILLGEMKTGFAVQRQIQTTHGAISPAITASKSAAFVSVALALKSAPAGTAPTADPRIVKVLPVDCRDNAATSFTQHFPLKGNNLVVGWIGAGSSGLIADSRALLSVTDSAGNSCTVSEGVGNGLSGFAQCAYKLGAATSPTNIVTIKPQVDNVSTAFLYDVFGTGLVPDTVAFASGFQTNAADIATVTITPRTLGGIFFSFCGINNGALRELTDTGLFASFSWALEEDGGGNAWHEDNGWAHAHVLNLAPKTLTWTNSNSGAGDGVADWAALAMAFAKPIPTFCPDYTRFPKSPIARNAQGLNP
jgi:hypothetical protein